MFELTTGADALGLQSVAETAQRGRREGRNDRKNVSLITTNGPLDGLGILNILNGFSCF